MKKTYFKPGTYNAICDVCGFQFKADEMTVRYDGWFVCAADWESKHPAEYARIVTEKQTVPIHAPDPEPIFIQVNYLE